MNSEKIRETNDKFIEKLLNKTLKESEWHTLAVWLKEVNNFLVEYDRYIAEAIDKLARLP
jgi:thiaminase